MARWQFDAGAEMRLNRMVVLMLVAEIMRTKMSMGMEVLMN